LFFSAIDHYLRELAFEVYLDNSPFAVNISLFRDIESVNFRFEPHAEVPKIQVAMVVD